MAKSPKSETDEPTLLQSTDVTYMPGPHDPPKVTWNRHVFHANVPKKITDQAMIEAAKGNKFFHVGLFDPQKDAVNDSVPEPKTAAAYRAWAVHWLKDIESVDAMCERWANEAQMRERLEVGYDDLKYLSSLFQPRLDDLIRREDEPRRKRDELVEKNELAGLELQIHGIGNV